jgi:lysophospholipase L1-like esterase
VKALRFLAIQLALVLVLATTAIFLAEQVARRRFPELRVAAERQQRPENLFIQFDRRLGWAHIPGATVRFTRLEFDTRVSINEDGFRGPRVPIGRRSGWNRIVVLGDSYVFGHGVNDDETFCVRLAELFPQTEVVNLGVTGYSTDQELLLLEDRALAYEPDVVVLCFYANDLLDNGHETAWGLYRKPRFLLLPDGSVQLESETVTEGVPLRMRIQRELRRRFVLYDVIAYRLRRGEPDAPAAGAPRELSRALVRRIAQLCHEGGAPLLLVVLPGIEDPALFDGLPPPGTGTRLDLAPLFSDHEQAHPDSALGFEHDTHWTARGHRFVAGVLAEEIERQGWIAVDRRPGLE